MKQILIILIIIVFLIGCGKVIEPVTTTHRIATTTLAPTTTTTTTSTTTSSTTTTTFTIPSKGGMCGDIYSIELDEICGTDDANFFVVAPEYAKCTLGAQRGAQDILYITITNYNVAPYKGIQVEKSPIFTLSSNIATNEVGEISARYTKSTMNEVAFLQKGYFVEVATWKTGKNILCTSEETLSLAKRVSNNINKLP